MRGSRRSAAGAEAGSGGKRVSAGGAGERGCLADGNSAGADLAGNIGGLHGVIGADSPGHQEGFDESEKSGNAGPTEDKVKNAESVAVEIEVMQAKAAEEEGQENSDDLLASSLLIFGVEPCALMLGHSGGVERIGVVQSGQTSRCWKGYGE